MVFFFSGPSASEEASKLYGVWRETEIGVSAQSTTASTANLATFYEFSKGMVTCYIIRNGQLYPPGTMAVTWSFRDGKLCQDEIITRKNEPFLEALFSPAPGVRSIITIVDENTIHMESTDTYGGKTVTSFQTLVRSSPAEREAAIKKRLTSTEEFDAQFHAPIPSSGEAPGNESLRQPVPENGPL